ncbi:MATE family efflux transporter [Geobacter sp.]|uniref:MATE family efflux transporter n=1 Tax=Geobacter sp. TaxID=46610 RepID=UPI0027B895E9|nr:MATE family efflux transporter [Geobacter sp.]
MDHYLLPLFIVNIVIILADAAIGYHVAPALMRRFTPDPETADLSVRGMRTMLGGVVALYMFFNCLGYFRHNGIMLMAVTAIVVVDMGAQLVVKRKVGKGREE